MGFIEWSINMFAVVWKCQLFGTMEITTVSILSYSKSILQSTAKCYTGNLFFFFLLLSRTFWYHSAWIGEVQSLPKQLLLFIFKGQEDLNLLIFAVWHSELYYDQSCVCYTLHINVQSRSAGWESDQPDWFLGSSEAEVEDDGKKKKNQTLLNHPSIIKLEGSSSPCCMISGSNRQLVHTNVI